MAVHNYAFVPTDHMTPLAQAIIDDRFALHLSGPKFAHLMGVSQTTVWKWESDKAVPTEHHKKNLLRVLEEQLGVKSRVATILKGGHTDQPEINGDTMRHMPRPLIRKQAPVAPASQADALIALAAAASELAAASKQIAESIDRLSKMASNDE